jgi:hypothetical protein
MHLDLELSQGRKLPLMDTMKRKKFPLKDRSLMAMLMFANYESDDNTGSGAIVANFHIASKSGDKVDIAQVAN